MPEEGTLYECMLYAGIKKSGNMITYFSVGDVSNWFEVLFATSIYLYLYRRRWARWMLANGQTCRFSPMSLHQLNSVFRSSDSVFFPSIFFFVWYTSLASIIIYMWQFAVCRVPCATNAWNDLTLPAFVRWRRFRCDNLSDTEGERKKNANESTI